MYITTCFKNYVKDAFGPFFYPVLSWFGKNGTYKIVWRDLSLKTLIPNIFTERKEIYAYSTTAKIKVRIFHPGNQVWNSVRTLCEAFADDSEVDLLLIGGIYANDSHVAKIGYAFVSMDVYDVAIDRPDIFIFTKHQGSTIDLSQVRKFAKMLVVAPQSLIRYTSSDKAFAQNWTRSYARYSPDYYLIDALIYYHLHEAGMLSEKYVQMGNPKYDDIFNAFRQSFKKLKKFEGKKVILYAPDHGLMGHNIRLIHDMSTADLYMKAFFSYAEHHPEMGFIFRPHSQLLYELRHFLDWKEHDFSLLRQYCQDSPNLIFDEADSYSSSFALADAIVTDAGCGIIASALPTMKPMGILYRSWQEKDFEPELTTNYYKIHSEGELTDFFELVSQGEDPKKLLRIEAMKKFVTNYDGKNGKRMKDFIKKVYINQYVGKRQGKIGKARDI